LGVAGWGEGAGEGRRRQSKETTNHISVFVFSSLPFLWVGTSPLSVSLIVTALLPGG